jgi:DNA-binding transcriptional LysR family regulator
VELRHLRHFLAVAETRHFGRAAEQLHIAQPALSQSIRQLEAELGATLLARTTRQVSLTPAGSFFRAETRRLIEGLDDTVRGVRRIAEGRSGLLRVAFTGTAAFDQLPRIARIVQQDLPGIALEVVADQLTPAQLDALRSGHVDLGLLRPPVAGDDIKLRVVLREELVLALPSDHRLAEEAGLEVVDVAHDTFVMYADAHSAVNEAIVRSCRAAGFAPRREHEAANTSVLLALVAAGLGVALVPQSARSLPLHGVVFRDVAGAASIDLALAWVREHPSPLVATLVAALEAHDYFAGDPDRQAHPTSTVSEDRE